VLGYNALFVLADYNVLKIQRVHGWSSQEGSTVTNVPSEERKIIK